MPILDSFPIHRFISYFSCFFFLEQIPGIKERQQEWTIWFEFLFDWLCFATMKWFIFAYQLSMFPLSKNVSYFRPNWHHGCGEQNCFDHNDCHVIVYRQSAIGYVLLNILFHLIYSANKNSFFSFACNFVSLFFFVFRVSDAKWFQFKAMTKH